MKLTEIRSNDERQILTSCIVHDSVLALLHAKLGDDKQPFENKWSNTVLHWCRSYFVKYHKAPRKHIKQLFLRYAQKHNGDEEHLTLIESFLSRLSKDYQALGREVNEKYVTDIASNHFDLVRAKRLQESLEAALDVRDLEQAKQAIKDYQPVQFSTSDWVNPTDKDVIQRTLKYFEEDRSLIQLPKALGSFLSPHLEREGFVVFQAPEKRGKSFWLLEMVYRAMVQRRRTLYYVIGDMSEREAMRRLYGRMTRKPYARNDKVRVISGIKKKKEGLPVVDFEIEERSKPSVGEVLKAVRKISVATSTKELPLKVKAVAAGVITASQIEQDVKELNQSGWIVDVVVIDYLDLVAPEGGMKQQDFRHQVNESWKIFRRISLEQHCLLLGATQAAASAYEAKTVRKKDFSEDKRKNAHVTGLVGINQTAEEKEQGLYRLNWVFLRDGKWSDTQTVWAAGELAIACPCVISTF
jgi:ACT domain-containing protein